MNSRSHFRPRAAALSGFIFLCLLLLAAANTNAQFSWTTNADGTIGITGYSGASSIITVPDAISGSPVTSIAPEAFQGVTNLNSVTILANLTNVGAGAFSQCTNLVNIYFNGSAPEIDPTAFAGDIQATAYYLPGTSGWSSPFAGIPAVMTAPASQFQTETTNGGVAITNYIGPGGNVLIPAIINSLPVTTFAPNAFAENGFSANAVTNVVIPGSVTSMDGTAFVDCVALISLTIPASMTNIGSRAFINCGDLASVYFMGNAPAGSIQLAGVGNKLKSVFYVPGTTGWSSLYSSIPTVPLPYFFQFGPSGIAVNGLLGNIGTAIIPSSFAGEPITAIGNQAFSCSTNLVTLEVPVSVTNIGDSALEGCTNLSCAYFMSNAPSFGSNVFLGDSNVTAYYLPGASGWSSSFGGVPTVAATPLRQFSYTTNINQIAIIGFGTAVSNGTVITPPFATSVSGFNGFYAHYITNVLILGAVTNIGTEAFNNCANLTNVTMPNTVLQIGASAFQGCPNLANINIPTSLTTIGQYAFSGCPIKNIVIPGTLTNMGSFAFYNCVDLTNVTLENGVTDIGAEAFYFCTGLEFVNFPGTLTNIGAYAFEYCDLFEIALDPGIHSIGASAFVYCGWLSDVTIPSTVINIGAYAFADTYAYDIFFAGNAPPANSSVFYNDPQATIYYYSGTTGWESNYDGFQTVLVPYSFVTNGDGVTITGFCGAGDAVLPVSIEGLPVTDIAPNVFSGMTNLTGAVIPPGVTNVGENAFASCSSLSSVCLTGNAPEADLSVFAGDTAVIYYVGGTGWTSPFAGLPAEALPLGIMDNGLDVFLENYTGTNGVAVIPSFINYIGSFACGWNNTLASLYIPSTVGWWDNDAFYSCQGLTNVIFADGLASIGPEAFKYCSGLGSVKIPASMTNLGQNAFSSCTNLTNVFFCGNAPVTAGGAFADDNTNLATYYLPGAMGWSLNYWGYPTSGPPALHPSIQTSDGSFGVRKGVFGFNITGVTNIPVLVVACTNLANPVWTPLQTVTLPNGSSYFNDPQWSNYPGRFYGLAFP